MRCFRKLFKKLLFVGGKKCRTSGERSCGRNVINSGYDGGDRAGGPPDTNANRWKA